MPELPDVEIFGKYARKKAMGKKISDVKVNTDKVLWHTSGSRLKKELKGVKIVDTARVGKYLFVKLSDGNWLMIHFGMTGYLEEFTEHTPEHARIVLSFSDGKSLALVWKRMLGKTGLVESPSHFAREKNLGPDAAKITQKQFREAIRHSRQRAKAFLMDQSNIAGIGNVYADEVLYQARIHPEKHIDILDDDEIQRLHTSIKEVIRTAISSKADPDSFPDNYLIKHRQAGARCPACKGKVERVKMAGRSTYYCPKCQKN